MTPTQSDLDQAKQVLSDLYLNNGTSAYTVGDELMFMQTSPLVNPNIHAIGIGRKVVNGRITDSASLRVYVKKKTAKSKLLLHERILSDVDGIPVDIILSQPASIPVMKLPRSKKPSVDVAIHPWRTRQRPIYSGISVAHQNVTAGTLSCLCRSTRLEEIGEVYVLSNNHVFANVNKALPQSKLYQPGPADNGTTADHFADLHRFVPIQLSPGETNLVDAAIGVLSKEISWLVDDSTQALNQIGQLSGPQRAVEGMMVCKHGRTTGYTEGVITDESLDVKIRMDHRDPNIVALFKNQMRIDGIDPYPAFGLGGDSGSLVVTKESRNAVGLYFAGPANGSYGIANYIFDVLNELEIELLVNTN